MYSPPVEYHVYDESLDRIANMTSHTEALQWVLITDATILSLTIIGSLSILGSMAILELKGRSATTRMRIVQSLVLSDLVLGIVGLTSNGLTLSGNLVKGTVSCDGLGLLLVSVLWTEHLWTLALAFGTFMILIHPLHYITSWLEKRWYLLWLFVWVVCIAVGVLGYELYGYVPSGGICYYPDNSGLYGELMQFIPRGMVFLCITYFYARLYIFLKRPDKIRSPYSDPGTGQYSTHGGSGNMARRFSAMFKPYKAEEPAPKEEVADVPPWERVELPVFQIDGQRYGGTAANTAAQAHPNLWANWNGMNGKKRNSSTVTTPPHQSRPASTRQFGSQSSVTRKFGSTSSGPLSPRSIMTPILSNQPEMPSAEYEGGPERQRNSSTTSEFIHTPSPSSDLEAPPHIRRDSAITNDSQSSPRHLPIPKENDHRDPDDDLDLMGILANTTPTGIAQTPGQVEESYELVPESMASYLNRKTALLMLWFPLGYVLLFSVSLIRIIYDFVGTPPTALRAISRWFIFAQGILDALIYGLVEWHTKRVVRKRVHKGHFSNQGSRTNSQNASNLANAFRNLGRRSVPDNHNHKSKASRLGSRGQVSFAGVEEDPRSILQELDAPRKGSVQSSL